MEIGLMMTLSRPSEMSPTAPSDAAAEVTPAARKDGKKFRSITV
jgi:hypothetical protein